MHDVSQVWQVFCWDVDKGQVQIGKIEPTEKPYKYKSHLSHDTVTVYELKSFLGIHVDTSPAENDGSHLESGFELGIPIKLKMSNFSFRI